MDKIELIKKIQNKKREIDNAFEEMKYPDWAQREFTNVLKNYTIDLFDWMINEIINYEENIK